jgi:hypothetical protein
VILFVLPSSYVESILTLLERELSALRIVSYTQVHNIKRKKKAILSSDKKGEKSFPETSCHISLAQTQFMSVLNSNYTDKRNGITITDLDSSRSTPPSQASWHNPSTTGGRGRRITSSRPALARSQDPVSKKKTHCHHLDV